MRIYKATDYNDMSRKAANIISAQIIMKPDCVLGLATGSSPVGTYKQLIEWYNKNDLDFSEVTSINLDEYKGLSPEDPQSYRYFMNTHLFDHVNIDKNRTFVPDGLATDPEKACAEYNANIIKQGGIDLQLLGIGRNGHIGFNEPGTSFDSVTHMIELKESTRQDNARLFFDGKIDEVPTHAITMGISNILQAKKVLLVACGENKAQPIKVLVEGEKTTDVPASALQDHNDVVVIVDKAAASLLTK